MSLGMVLLIAGAAVGLIGWIMITIEAFKESTVWGICCLVVPLANVVYTFTRWEAARKGFLTMVAGLVLTAVGYSLGVGDAKGGADDAKERALQKQKEIEALKKK